MYQGEGFTGAIIISRIKVNAENSYEQAWIQVKKDHLAIFPLSYPHFFLVKIDVESVLSIYWVDLPTSTSTPVYPRSTISTGEQCAPGLRCTRSCARSRDYYFVTALRTTKVRHKPATCTSWAHSRTTTGHHGRIAAPLLYIMVA